MILTILNSYKEKMVTKIEDRNIFINYNLQTIFGPWLKINLQQQQQQKIMTQTGKTKIDKEFG